MAEIRKQPQPARQTTVTQTTPVIKKVVTPAPVLFTNENFKWMAIGGAIVILGMVLMSGGKNQNPDTFDPNVVYSFTRVTIAPILIIGGLLVEIFAIFRKPKRNNNV